MDPIYLDHAATTPMRAEVREEMAPYLDGVFGNPSSTHRWGREAAAALEDARARVAAALGARRSEIHFVRGGTESDNLALCGRVHRLRADGAKPGLVISAIEHRAVLEAARKEASDGAGELTTLDVSPAGELDLDALDTALGAGPCVVSVQWVNNEVGMVLPLPEVAARVAEAPEATLHTDAVQALGKVDVRVDEVPVDLLSLTGHKIYGPKGTGVLFVRTGVEIAPLLHGGGQEMALRPGTQDVAGAVGMARALELAVGEREAEGTRLSGLRARFEERVGGALADVRVNAGEAERAPHVSSLGVAGVDGTSLLISLDLEGIAASGGSACSSGAAKGSHVIRALYGEGDGHATVRFSLGRATTEAHVDRAAEVCIAVVERLRGSGGMG